MQHGILDRILNDALKKDISEIQIKSGVYHLI